MNLIGFGMVLLAVSGGILYAEGPPHGTGTRVWVVEFLPESTPGPEDSGDAADGQTTTVHLDFERQNITGVVFQFSFTDNYRFATLTPAGATFKVTSPAGVSSEQTVQPGQNTATTVRFLQLCTIPGQATVTARDLDEATERALSQHPPNENGTGEWTVEITVFRDYISPIHGSGDITWTAKTRADGYVMEVSERLQG